MSDRLTALVAEWRFLQSEWERGNAVRSETYGFCADELEAALSSTAPATCPKHFDTASLPQYRVEGNRLISISSEAQPAPSDVVMVPRGQVNKLAEAMDNFFPRLDHAGYHEQAEAEQQFAIELRAAALRNSADQSVPSDGVEVPRDVAREYVEASAAISDPIGDTEEELGLISDRFYAAQEALEQALAAALRQGGG